MSRIKQVFLNPNNLNMLSIVLLVGTIIGINPLWPNTAYAFLPSIALSLISLALSYRKLGVQRREMRRANGLCINCEYDLRATPGRCPECATPSAGVKQHGLHT